MQKHKYWKFGLLITLIASLSLIQTASAAILFDGADTGGVTADDYYIIDYDQSSTGDRVLQFGETSNYLKWDGNQFQISNDLDLNSNQIKSARVENVTAMPGGASGIGAGGNGRIVQLTVADAIAPGCIAPTCQPGPYMWTGAIWVPLTGGDATAVTASKIITVGPTGRDYTNIADGAAYLNTLSGGEMWIDPGTYPISTTVDLENIRVVGTDTAETTISVTGAGLMRIKDTDFQDLVINVDAGITSTYAMDIKYNASSHSAIELDQVDLKIGTGKYLFDSSAATAPTTISTFKDSTQSGTAGFVVRTKATANINSASTFTVIDQLGKDPIKISDWDVTIIGGGNVVTSGTINSVPDRTILVSPGMNIQGAVNSLGTEGGVIKLLIGVHNVTSSIVIPNNNIQLTGEGPGTILRAPAGTWIGGATVDDAVIQVGPSNGTSPKSNIIIDNFTIEVGPNIHGIQVNGGSEIKVMDMLVSSIAAKSAGRTGIVFTDGATTPGTRFTATRSIINSDTGTNRWVDGVHFDGDASFPGLLGYGNGITDSIISEVIVNEAQETSFAFGSVSASGIFSNRARNLGFNNGALGMFLINAFDVVVINNTFEGNNNTTSTGIRLQSEVDDSIIIGNTIRGGPQNFNIAISLNNANCDRNILDGNIIQGATTKFSDNGTATKIETNHVRSNVNPTVNDDANDGFYIGTLWINVTTQTVYASVNSTVGAAVWVPLAGGTGHTQNTDTGTTSNTFVLDNDNTGGNVQLQFGTTLNERLTWDNTAGSFVLSDDLYVQGNLGVLEGGASPTFYTIFQGGDQTTNITYTLPTTQGAANTFLRNNGSGTLNWATVGAATAVTNMFTFMAGGAAEQWRNMPTAVTEFDDDIYRRQLIDLTNATQTRLGVNVTVAGSTNAVLAIQYSLNQSTWAYLDGGTGPSVSISSTGLQTSSFVTITPAARTNVYLRVVGSGGNNSADPTLSTINLEVK